MKKSILMLVAIVFVSMTAIAQKSTKKKETFKVYGNCGMCKKKIEGSVNDLSGVYNAEWNVDTKKMTITYNASKTSISKLKQKIADAGYDSESHRAKKETYDNLHGCCQYDRPKK